MRARRDSSAPAACSGAPLLPSEDAPVALTRQLRVMLRRRATGARPPALLIYGQGRTGSTLLGSLLASHPRMTFGNEVLRGPVRWPLNYLEGLRAGSAPSSYSCHIKPYHLTQFQGISDVRGFLSAAHGKGWRLLHLRREDTLRHVLSNVSRNANARSHFTAGDGHATALVHVDPADLLYWMEQRDAEATREVETLIGLPHIQVSYERDLLPGAEAWVSVTKRVFDALGLPPHKVGTALRQINQGPLETLVSNYDEVVECVASSRFAHLLPDRPGSGQSQG